MRRAIVGTAGHVDHGKTRLVEALTGIDCDRWQEEKSRGITIDLGFAHLEEDDLEIGFIDVPGHERFLHNALAGLGGIRILLLVVAADEGVKPQTREHLAICSLLGIPVAVVALTKVDLVAADLVELARLEVTELLEETPFAGAGVVAVSSRDGTGVAELRRMLAELATRFPTPDEPELPVRLPVDRSFLLQGLGLVVTGTLVSGEVGRGAALALLPDGGSLVKVRGIEVHGRPRDRARRGERTALQLAGVARADIGRGHQLVEPEAFAASSRLAARLTLLPDAPKPLSGSTPVRFHLLSSEVVGRMRPLSEAPIRPGASGAVEIALARPVVAVRGDRFIIRRPSPPATLGGGVVLDPAWKRRRGAAAREAADALGQDDGRALALWVEEAGEAGAESAGLARRLGRRRAAVERGLEDLTAAGELEAAPDGQGHGRRWLAPAAYERVRRRTREVLDRYFESRRLARGMPKAEAVERVLPGGAAELADVYLAWLERDGVLEIAGGEVNLPGRSAALSGDESALARRILAAIEAAGLEPPPPAQLASEVGGKPQIVEGLVRYLEEGGHLARLPGGLVISTAAIDGLRRDLGATGWKEFTVGEFKTRFALTRKWAIPLLEHLDSIGATRRQGDKRVVLGG